MPAANSLWHIYTNQVYLSRSTIFTGKDLSHLGKNIYSSYNMLSDVITHRWSILLGSSRVEKSAEVMTIN